ncbi:MULTISPECIES: hypothetical protein [Fusobacterium]|uniref:hypothetical protein n=1 Tax=Fusobacterium TaxID=848 RepID=UPI0025C0267E|nr:hypothetical protein [Fusobacterium sp.]MCI7224130.1 hypothetical protein [Fusobacterium sp.]MDD7411192.1 hypothetical protein [Fusobacteriaceae bacterium]MDY5306278.1 hypothetical protein [Fusobacterium gastrosuis]MDY5713491.1 hypothetical protein [Fusobacterium gastrosuis]
MTNFSEKIVRVVSLVFLVFTSLLTYYKNIYYSPLILLAIMIYFSTKGVQMFEDKIYFSTRVIFWLLFISLIFLRIYLNEKMGIDSINMKKFLTTAGVISISAGLLIGDFFAKYIYIRLKFCINRLSSSSHKGIYKIVKMENIEKKYMNRPGKKMKINFFHITLEVNGEKKKFLLEKELYEKIKDKTELNINIKKGMLGMYYGVGLEE